MGCAQGHPWTAESTIDRPGRARECRLCARARGKAWAQKKAAEKRLQRAEPQPKAFVKCAIADCPEGAKVKGWCNVHYQRWHRYGDPLVQKRIHGDDDRRFWSKVDKDGPVPGHKPELGPCWVWQGKPGKHGYCQVRMGGKSGRFVLVHRWAYEQLVGEIPDGLQLDHMCHTDFSRCTGGDTCSHRRCVNPAHLQPTTSRINTLRARTVSAANAVKTHCKHGHAFSEENTRWYRGARVCKECGRAAVRRRREAAQESGAEGV
jgi:hypothetical protein